MFKGVGGMEKDISELIIRYPLLKKIMSLEPVLWENASLKETQFPINGIDVELIDEGSTKV